jgi:sulfur carrier protein
MRLRVNGKEVELVEGLRLMDFLHARGLDPRMVVVEHNDSILPREQYPNIMLHEGDRLEIVQMTAGG